MLTLQQLTTPTTEDEALQTMLDILNGLGYQATSWQSGAIQLTILRLFARMYSNATQTIADVAAGGFTTLAASANTAVRSGFLTLLAKYVYNLARLDPQPTIGQILLTSSAGAPVHTWSAGDIIVADQPNGTAGANTYTCTAGGTLGPSSTLSLEFKADVAGAAANIAPNTTLYLWTPLVGVTPTNPLYGTSNTWITTPGADAESDQRLLARCIGRWSRLTYGNTNGAYVGWALEALPSLTRVAMESAPGDGTVTLVGATAAGPIDAGQITTIENYINGVSDGVGRRPINDVFTAVGASTVTSPTLNITAYCLSAYQSTIASQVTAALLKYFGSIPIGGTILTGTQGRVLFSVMMGLPFPDGTPGIYSGIVGLKSLVFTGLSSDILLSPGQVYVPVINVTTQSVAPGS